MYEGSVPLFFGHKSEIKGQEVVNLPSMPPSSSRMVEK